VSTTAQFTGSIPELYDRQLGPVLFEPYGADLVARVPRGEELRVLELACGTGIVTRRLREALPASTAIVATDLNDAMVAYARSAVPAAGIEWRQADAQALPFPDESFDALLCQFGFMFLPDKGLGFREARRVLAPGGVLLGNVWAPLDENPAARVVAETVAELFPADPPRFFETPYGYDRDKLRADLEAAGWSDVRLEVVRLAGESPTAGGYALGFVRGSPLTHELVARGADLDAVERKAAEALAAHIGDRPLRAEQAAVVITARRESR
jgi:SAM-dependent methyltransferase